MSRERRAVRTKYKSPNSEWDNVIHMTWVSACLEKTSSNAVSAHGNESPPWLLYLSFSLVELRGRKFPPQLHFCGAEKGGGEERMFSQIIIFCCRWVLSFCLWAASSSGSSGHPHGPIT